MGNYIDETDIGIHYETSIDANSDPPLNVVDSQILKAESRLEKRAKRAFYQDTRTEKVKPDVTSNSIFIENTPISAVTSITLKDTTNFDDNYDKVISASDYFVEDAELGIISFRDQIYNKEELKIISLGGHASGSIPELIKEIALLLFDEIELTRKLQIQSRDTEDVDIGSITLKSTVKNGIEFDLKLLRKNIDELFLKLEGTQRSNLV